MTLSDLLPFRRPAGPRRLPLVALLTAMATLAGVTACDDPFKVKASYENGSQAFQVYAMTGSATNLSSALLLPVRSVTRVDGTFAFDVAFDLNSAGNVVLIPVSVLGQSPSGARAVGIATNLGSYAQILEAPTSGYTYDSTTVVTKGQAFVIKAQETACSSSFTPYQYAKAVIDSIDMTKRTMIGHVTINLNCGFRSLRDGLPTY
jgi:hypothetical protein